MEEQPVDANLVIEELRKQNEQLSFELAIARARLKQQQTRETHDSDRGQVLDG